MSYIRSIEYRSRVMGFVVVIDIALFYNILESEIKDLLSQDNSIKV